MFPWLIHWILLLLGIAYGAVTAVLVAGLFRLKRPVPAADRQPLSVIIAARNEEAHLNALLDSLDRQTFPKDLFEVIVVDDRSTDATSSLLHAAAERFPFLHVVRIDENRSDLPHKKHALQRGIAAARHEILVFTDADCIAAPEWLDHVSRAFTPEVGAVAGYSPYANVSSRSYLRLEEFTNTLFAASAIQWGRPYLCTGRNFAYRRSVFTAVGGFDSIKQSVSGDDDLMLQRIAREKEWTVRYMTGAGSIVRTAAPQSLRQFIHQRTRHVSASRYYPLHITAMYGVQHLFHLAIVIGFFIAPQQAVLALLWKYNADALLVSAGREPFGEQFGFPSFILNDTAMMLYSFVIGPLGYLRPFDWKGTTSA